MVVVTMIMMILAMTMIMTTTPTEKKATVMTNINRKQSLLPAAAFTNLFRLVVRLSAA